MRLRFADLLLQVQQSKIRFYSGHSHGARLVREFDRVRTRRAVEACVGNGRWVKRTLVLQVVVEDLISAGIGHRVEQPQSARDN